MERRTHTKLEMKDGLDVRSTATFFVTLQRLSIKNAGLDQVALAYLEGGSVETEIASCCAHSKAPAPACTSLPFQLRWHGRWRCENSSIASMWNRQ